ncbi:biotin transporter BioY [Streptomyces muensis]|uniref:Biotin transporter n=1 Tax=Streptomyces muensis TaxID=1077944 RepID=A0A9X1TQ78_STRM4|nr:biotin transporter BioY [Streptomyces muensis]MCF1592318.1 biotin transporter BioY [Streptomyces muensis]
MATAAIASDRPRVLADLIPGALARDAILVLAGAGVMGVSAQVAIHTPLSPVPFTLQTFAVLVVGAALGTGRGAWAALTYVSVGIAGVPWFAAHGSGWGGPSFGYVIGLALAAPLAGLLAEHRADRHVVGTVVLMALGTAVVYLCGTLWLAHALSLGAEKSFELGVRPFLVADVLKCAAAAGALPATWKIVDRFTS